MMTLFNSATVQQTFERAAGAYDGASHLSRELADRLLEHLDLVRLQPTCILDLGAGTGYITQLLKQRYPYAQIISLDFSAAMLHQPTYYQRQASALRICANAAQLPLAEACIDLVVSGLMLPWCQDAEAIFTQVQRVLKPGGLFLFSTFGPDTLGELRASWATVDELPHVHGFFDLHDVGDALLRAGFSDPIMQTEWLTLMYADSRRLFADLKNTGAINLLLERRKTLTGKKRVQQFLAEYTTYQTDNGKLPATFEVIYGHCWKFAQPVAREHAAEVSIPVSSIKRRRGD